MSAWQLWSFISPVQEVAMGGGQEQQDFGCFEGWSRGAKDHQAFSNLHLVLFFLHLMIFNVAVHDEQHLC